MSELTESELKQIAKMIELLREEVEEVRVGIKALSGDVRAMGEEVRGNISHRAATSPLVSRFGSAHDNLTGRLHGLPHRGLNKVGTDRHEYLFPLRRPLIGRSPTDQ